METIQTLLLVLQVIVAITLIGFILIQHGKGADAGAAFGSGASATVFGSRGSGNFLTKATTFLAIVFLANSLFLGYLSAHADRGQESLLEGEPVILDRLTEEMPGEEAGQGTSSDMPASIPEEISQDIEGSKLQDVPADTPADVIQDEGMDAPVSDIPEIPNQ